MIFVTGASGNVGGAVVSQLQARQQPFRMGSRRAKSPQTRAGADIVPFDFLDQATFRPALQGCQTVFLLRPPAIANTRQTLNPFLDIAWEEGVEHVVFISVAGAADNPLVPHHAVEQHLRQGPPGWTILRPGFFAQNLGDAYRQEIMQRDRVFVPAGTGRVAFIDARDIATVAVNVLTGPQSHRQQTYTLTGPEALTFTEVVQALSAELGRTISYRAASIGGYGLHLLRQDLPLAQVLVQTVLHVGLRFGQAEAVDSTLPRLLGQAPHYLRDYIHDHRELWLKL